MLFLSFWDDVGGAIVEALRSLMLSFCDIIYKLIVFFFDIFVVLGKAEILTDDTLLKFYERIGLILGLFMIFRVTFSLIQYVINPDLMVDKQKGLVNIIKRVLVVVVLLGVTPSIFKFAYEAQNLVIESNVIPTVITGKNIDSTNSGANLAWYAFSSFYSYNETALNRLSSGTTKDEAKALCPEYKDGDNNSLIKSDFMKNSSLGYAFNCVNTQIDVVVPGYDDTTKAFLIDFDGNGFVAVVVGVLILWMILMYVIQVGVRVIQLAYLQLIAPVPIIMYLAPKGEDTLNKWIKQCTTTYLDFFIRVAILYFVVFIIELLMSNDYSIFEESLGDVSNLNLTFMKIIMIIAILIFAQRVPKLLQEVFPVSKSAASFDFGLNPKKSIMEPLKAAYNSPLGWAPKALGWAGKKTIGAIDRKVHNLPKPRNKVQQYFDKLAPGYAEVAKNKNDAITQERERQNRMERGRKVATSSTYNEDVKDQNGVVIHKKGDLNSNVAFRNQAFRDSYDEVQKAKGNVKKSSLQLSQAQAQLNAAYNNYSGTEKERNDRIARATKIFEQAQKNDKAMQGQLDLAKAKHDTNRKIYARDAQVEDDFKYYDDMQKVQSGYQEIDELKLGDKLTSNDGQIQAEVQRRQQEVRTEQENMDRAQQYFNQLNGVNSSSASDNGAPTEAFSAIAEKYRQEDEQIQAEIQRREQEARTEQENMDRAQQYFNQLNGVENEDGNGPKVTAENSIFVQLDQEAKQEREMQKQKEMQEEFKNRKIDE